MFWVRWFANLTRTVFSAEIILEFHFVFNRNYSTHAKHSSNQHNTNINKCSILNIIGHLRMVESVGVWSRPKIVLVVFSCCIVSKVPSRWFLLAGWIQLLRRRPLKHGRWSCASKCCPELRLFSGHRPPVFWYDRWSSSLAPILVWIILAICLY